MKHDDAWAWLKAADDASAQQLLNTGESAEPALRDLARAYHADECAASDPDVRRIAQMVKMRLSEATPAELDQQE